jgi:hypothetical protein
MPDLADLVSRLLPGVQHLSVPFAALLIVPSRPA